MAATEEASGITVETADAVAIVRLGYPPVNAFTAAAWTELGETIKRVGSDPSVGAIILTGHPGRLFSSGQDTRELTSRSAAAAAGDAMIKALGTLADAAVPTVAAIHRAAIGGGMLLASSTDCVVCTAETTFSLPEIRFGIVGGYGFLVNRLPHNEARRLALSGEPMSAERAYQLGFVQRVVATDDEVVGAATEVATTFAPHAHPANGVVPRHVFNAVEHVGPIEAFDIERRSAT